MSRLPVAFVGHGAPLLAVEYARAEALERWAHTLPRPEAILVLSAHWEAPLALGQTGRHDVLVYDFGRGLPDALFTLQWPAPGAPILAERLAELLPTISRTDRGLDHGAWCPLLRMFPRADVPTLQLSVPASLDDPELISLGRTLAPLRDEGVLILGSGNLVHNVATLDITETRPPPPWAVAFDRWVTEATERRDVDALAAWMDRAPHPRLAHPTPEHFRPFLVCVGAALGDPVSWPVTGFEHGSTSRRSAQFG